MLSLILTNELHDDHLVLAVGERPGDVVAAEPVARWREQGASSFLAGPAVVAAIDDGLLALVHGRGVDGRGSELTVVDLVMRATVADLELGLADVAAVSLRGARVFLGEHGRVRCIDLHAGPTATPITVSALAATMKPFDHFAWSGDELFAVDDVVWPYYADWLHAPAGAEPALRRRVELPEQLGGAYQRFVTRRVGDDLEVFALVGRVHEGGYFQGVLRMRVSELPVPSDPAEGFARYADDARDDGDDDDDPDEANESAFDDGHHDDDRPSFEWFVESVDDFTHETRSLFGGSLTRMRGIALSPDERLLVVAMGARGIACVAIDDHGVPPCVSVLATREPCLDVQRVAGRLFALLGEPEGDSRALVELVVDGRGVRSVAETRVRTECERFVGRAG